jgi:hypothetical protein
VTSKIFKFQIIAWKNNYLKSHHTFFSTFSLCFVYYLIERICAYLIYLIFCKEREHTQQQWSISKWAAAKFSKTNKAGIRPPTALYKGPSSLPLCLPVSHNHSL